jgi:hypothetical protein
MIGELAHRKRLVPRLAIALLIATALGCQSNGEPVAEYFTSIEYLVNDKDAKARLIAEIEDSTERVDLAVTGLADVEIANAVVKAKNNGATVRVAADADFSGDEGLQILEDADIDVEYGDGELFYLPEPTLASLVNDCGLKNGLVRCPAPNDAEEIPTGAMYRPGSFNLMSHNFVILETRTVWNFTRPFDGKTGPSLAYRAESERMREVFEREFQQLHGGVFATTLDVYNGPIKSSPQNNPNFNAKSYLTDRGELEVRFNPQDRLTKTIIDDTYRARASVFIMTDNLAEDFLVDALRYKKNATIPGENGPAFEVRVIVNRSRQSDIVRDELEELGILRYAPAEMEALPTIAIYDALRDPNGDKRPRRVHIASQPLWRAGPFDVFRPDPANDLCPPTMAYSDCIVVHPADYFVDGNMWSLLEYRGQIHKVEEIDRMAQFFNTVWEDSEAP